MKILSDLESKIEELERQMTEQANLSDYDKIHTINKEYKKLKELVGLRQEYEKTIQHIKEDEELSNSDDPEILQIVNDELPQLNKKAERLERKILSMLSLSDDKAGNSVIVEIRAGTGGEEAALFAGDLFRMYSRFAENNGWQVEVIDKSPTDLGGFKEIVFILRGDDAYKLMQYESGVHRVQRVPVTESGGRIHTSAASVAVLPEVPEEEIDISPEDLKIDTFRASGAGGQHVNKIESAVRITHIPTNTIVTCQAERSQHKNRELAMKILKSKIADLVRQKREMKTASQRKSQVGSGDRSEKIRTYNFPQNRITDHRIGYTAYNLGEILDGCLEDLFDAIQAARAEEILDEITQL